ncbi:MAG: isoprenylcysteine carboxylmethyltransferase family protein [Akkermansiaceae bacterium]|nr:isoprenylcysteine carboxylmethyltransferase family protein [Akkermansiaceae bacterium]
MIVFYFACIYWGGVVLNALRIRKRTGKTPSLRPRLKVDVPLWIGWATIIILWAGAPWLGGAEGHFFQSHLADLAGLVVASAGLLGTWWCYATLGDAWAISQNKERTTTLVRKGPYGLMRHPIYSFQWLILAGLFLYAPGLPLLVALVVLTICMPIKARIEERGLQDIFGADYDQYAREVGRFVPGV